MIAWRIIATLFVAFSYFSTLLKNECVFEEKKPIAIATLYGWLWRTFVIVIIWIL